MTAIGQIVSFFDDVLIEGVQDDYVPVDVPEDVVTVPDEEQTAKNLEVRERFLMFCKVLYHAVYLYNDSLDDRKVVDNVYRQVVEKNVISKLLPPEEHDILAVLLQYCTKVYRQ